MNVPTNRVSSEPTDLRPVVPGKLKTRPARPVPLWESFFLPRNWLTFHFSKLESIFEKLWHFSTFFDRNFEFSQTTSVTSVLLETTWQAESRRCSFRQKKGAAVQCMRQAAIKRAESCDHEINIRSIKGCNCLIDFSKHDLMWWLEDHPGCEWMRQRGAFWVGYQWMLAIQWSISHDLPMKDRFWENPQSPVTVEFASVWALNIWKLHVFPVVLYKI